MHEARNTGEERTPHAHPPRLHALAGIAAGTRAPAASVAEKFMTLVDLTTSPNKLHGEPERDRSRHFTARNEVIA